MRPQRWVFGGARSWRRGNRDGSANGAGDGESHDGAAITDVLDRYDDRAKHYSRGAQQLAEQRAQFRLQADRLLEKVIEPTLDEVGAEVKSRGHEWRVEQRVDIQGQPAVACLFRPRPLNGNSGDFSELSFRCLFPDRLATITVIHRRGRARELPARSHTLSTADASHVAREVRRFLSEVLDEG